MSGIRARLKTLARTLGPEWASSHCNAESWPESSVF
jgi:hypothetical protein